MTHEEREELMELLDQAAGMAFRIHLPSVDALVALNIQIQKELFQDA